MTDPLPLEIGPADLQKLRDENAEFILLDVREQNEFDFVRMEGSRLIPMSEIQSRVDELEAIRDEHIVVHCHHGGRSMQVVQWLAQQGYCRVQNLAGGIDRWAVEVEPSLPRY